MTLTSVVKYLDTTTKPGWVTWAVLNASPLLSLCQCTSLPHTTDGGLLRLSETPEKAELQWCVFETNALQDFAFRNINHAFSPRVTACELTLPNYTKGPRHQEACPFLGTFYSQECGTDVPFSEWSRFTCLNSQEQVQDLLCRQAHQWLTGQDVPNGDPDTRTCWGGHEQQGQQASMRVIAVTHQRSLPRGIPCIFSV